MTIKLTGSFGPITGAMSVGDLAIPLELGDILTMESGDPLTTEAGVELGLDVVLTTPITVTALAANFTSLTNSNVYLGQSGDANGKAIENLFTLDTDNTNTTRPAAYGTVVGAYEEFEFDKPYRFTDMTTAASAGNPSTYPTDPFQVHSWNGATWDLEYESTLSYQPSHVHVMDFTAQRLKITFTSFGTFGNGGDGGFFITINPNWWLIYE